MRVQNIQYYQHLNINRGYSKEKGNVVHIREFDPNPINLSYFSNVSFAGKKAEVSPGPKALRKLYKYGLPCMYSGITMIPISKVNELEDKRVFSADSDIAVDVLAKFKKSLQPAEQKLFEIIKVQSEINPNKNLQMIFQDLRPHYLQILRKDQQYIFRNLTKMSKHLPEEFHEKFDKLMFITNKKLNEEPMTMNFSRKMFKYQLGKALSRYEDKPLFDELIGMVDKFPHYSEKNSKLKQQKTLDSIYTKINDLICEDKIKKSQVLIDLYHDSVNRIQSEEMVYTFSRKSFIYDLNVLLDGLHNEDLKQAFIIEASKLPSSEDSFAAKVIRLADMPPERIGKELLLPSTTTIEHIRPRSRNGDNKIENYGLACARFNSDRSNITFFKQIIRIPDVEKNIQKYVDKLIELHNNGTFEREKTRLTHKYIIDLKDTLEETSEDILKIDISKLKIPDEKAKQYINPNETKKGRKRKL